MFFWREKRPSPRSNPRKHLVSDSWPAAIYAVGDVHGCFDDLLELTGLIARDAQSFAGESWLVLLGDYVDRGLQSDQVLQWLCEPSPAGLRRIALKGNHEEMMADFIKDPRHGRGWLRYGGLETLRSYGITDRQLESSPEKQSRLIGAHVPPEHITLVERLPLSLSVPGVSFVHAYAVPGIPPSEQDPKLLLWGTSARHDGDSSTILVHGHVPALEVVNEPRRICLDTGAFATGRLSAVRLLPDGSRKFFQSFPNAAR
jgi:serine/threonine protein phosphatase 1